MRTCTFDLFLVIKNIPHSEWRFEVTKSRQLIGRAEEAHIRIPPSYDFVSRRHAEIWYDRDGIWIRDVGSRAGTRVNGVQIQQPKPVCVAIGDRISLGELELLIVSSNRPTECLETDKLNSDWAGPPTEVWPGHLKTQEIPNPRSIRALMDQLTPAEMAVVLWMCRGYTTDEDIAEKVYRSPNTVRTQIGSILQKLGQHSRMDVVNWLKQMETRLFSVLEDDDDLSGDHGSATRKGRGSR